MIEKMKKLTFLVTSTEYEGFLEMLRTLGVVHVQELESGTASEDFRAGMELAERYKRVFTALDFARETYATDGTYKMKDVDGLSPEEVSALGVRTMEEIEAELVRENDLKHKIDATEKCIKALEPWGNFDWESVKRLAAEGCRMDFFACSSKAFRREWVDEYFATPVNEANKKLYFVTFADERPDIAAEHLELPERSLSYYRKEYEALTKALQESRERQYRFSEEYRMVLSAAQIENENVISLSKVRLSSESVAGDAVKLMTGWVLADKAEEVKATLEREHIYYEMAEPTLEDNVPVKLANNAYSRLFEPILRMYSLPNYHELDPTPFLAPFFMLFFGLCMGDAGYGVLILAAGVAARIKLGPEMKGFGTLGIILGAMTIVCGLLTGSIFGIDLTKQDWAFLAPVRPYFINEANYTLFGYSPMMVISVFIGLTQVLIGMCLSAAKAAKMFGWKYGVGKLSWVVTLLSAIVCFGLPACDVVLPEMLTWVLYGLMGIGVLGIFFFNSPNKNIFMNFGTGVWDTYNMATGLLGDLLSYIRLFALGLTGGVLGSVFNQLAFEMTDGMSIIGRLTGIVFILLFGHGINFALCMISSFVHPMRLTFVEFFKNADFEGGGHEYSPFRIRNYKK